MLTDERLAEIRKRADAATPGEWEAVEGTPNQWYVCVNGTSAIPFTWWSAGDEFEKDRRANAAFIAHARVDIPDLLNEIARLKAEFSEVKCELSGERAAADIHEELMFAWMDDDEGEGEPC